MFRRFLIVVLIFLVAVVVAADRIGAAVGAHVLASKVQTDEHLPNRPSATIGGFPFLTQAIGGKYKDVTITAHELPVDGVPVTRLTAHLHGVHLPASKVLGGSVSRVPVDRVDGTAFVSFADVDRYLVSQHLDLTITSDGGAGATVVDRVLSHGKRVAVSGAASVSVNGNVVHVRVSKLAGPLALIHRTINVSLPLQRLPFQIQLASVTLTGSGIAGVGAADHIVLGSH